jgi:hypothetical protein
MNLKYQMHSYGILVVTSQSMNKNFWVPHPILLCLQTSKCPTLLKPLLHTILIFGRGVLIQE